MKNALLIFMLLISCWTVRSQCLVTGEPYYGYCYGSLDRYLSRAIFMSDMTGQLYRNNDLASYNSNISLLTELKASFISRATGLWGEETRMDYNNPTQNSYNYYWCAKENVKNINQAFDCANLRRPIIEAAILEYITSDVNNIIIPQYVLNEFGNPFGYSNATHFDYLKIGYTNNSSVPDISRLEARMWIFYLAKEYIDMGYKAIHMGAFKQFDINDQSHYYTNDLFQKIRNYANSQNAFILINADSKEIYAGNTNNLLFDFLSSPIRPEDTFNEYSGLPCQDNLNTELPLNFQKYDPYVTVRNGGISPMGCEYEVSPILFNLDWWKNPSPGAPFYTNGDGTQPWGYDETGWFSRISEQCQSYWLENVSYAIKNDLILRGYLKMPGKEAIKPNDPDYQLINYPEVKDVVKNTIWEVNNRVNFSINTICYFDENGRIKTKYRLKVTNPDCTSIYTWHIKRPDGTWLPFTFGNERILDNMIVDPNPYSVYLRADNLGIQIANNEVIQIEKFLMVKVEPCLQVNDQSKKKFESNSDSLISKIKEDLNQDESFIVFPNPTNNNLTIKFSLNKSDNIKIYLVDMGGRVVTNIANDKLNQGNYEYLKNLEGMHKGAYLVVLEKRFKKFTKKIILN